MAPLSGALLAGSGGSGVGGAHQAPPPVLPFGPTLHYTGACTTGRGRKTANCALLLCWMRSVADSPGGPVRCAQPPRVPLLCRQQPGTPAARSVPLLRRRMRLPLQLGAGLPAVRLGRQLAGAGAPQHGGSAGAGAPGAHPQAQGRLLHTPRQRHGRAEDAAGAGGARAAGAAHVRARAHRGGPQARRDPGVQPRWQSRGTWRRRMPCGKAEMGCPILPNSPSQMRLLRNRGHHIVALTRSELASSAVPPWSDVQASTAGDWRRRCPCRHAAAARASRHGSPCMPRWRRAV